MKRILRGAFLTLMLLLPVVAFTWPVPARSDTPPEPTPLPDRFSIDAVALRYTAEEAKAMLSPEHLNHKELQRILTQSDGWLAALVLLREHLSRPGASLDESLGESKDAIFQYFAGEIFNGARAENQRILMLTAIPPSITQAEAVELSGSEEAPRLLEYLYRRHLFIDRRRGAQTSYQHHALFREFLLSEGRRRLSSDERAVASERAARFMAARAKRTTR